jgi:negative regulator of flagellin synthesis FlgM
MKIGNLPAVVMDQYKNTNKVRTNKTEAAAMGTDRLELSGAARLFDTALSAIKEAPEIRMDRVEAIRAQIAAGTYSINTAVIAQKMLGFAE